MLIDVFYWYILLNLSPPISPSNPLFIPIRRFFSSICGPGCPPPVPASLSLYNLFSTQNISQRDDDEWCIPKIINAHAQKLAQYRAATMVRHPFHRSRCVSTSNRRSGVIISPLIVVWGIDYSLYTLQQRALCWVEEYTLVYRLRYGNMARAGMK